MWGLVAAGLKILASLLGFGRDAELKKAGADEAAAKQNAQTVEDMEAGENAAARIRTGDDASDYFRMLNGRR